MQGQPGYGSTLRFGTAHWGGCNFVFCDGRVHMISYSIDPTTYSYLGNHRDGKDVSGGSY